MTNNFNEQGLVTYKEMRDNALSRLFVANKDLMKLNVWCDLGTNFDMILPGFMTYQQVAEFFDVSENAIKKHFKTSSNNYEELIEAGAKNYSVKEFRKLESKISDGTDNSNREIVGNTEVSDGIESTVPEKIKINNRGVVLLSLPAVIKLGMFMTGTEKAIEFRNLVISELQNGVRAVDAVKTLTADLLKSILNNANEGIIVEKNDIIKFIENVTEISGNVKLDRDTLEETKNLLDELVVTYQSMLNTKTLELKSVISNKNSREYYKINHEIRDINELVFVCIESKSRVQDSISTYISTSLESVDNAEVYNLSDAFIEIFPEYKNENKIVLNQALSDMKVKMAKAGFLRPVTYTSKTTKKIKIDENGNEIKKLKKGQKYTIKEEEIITTKVKYLEAEGYEWIFNKQVGEISRTNLSQIFKLSRYGFELFKKIFIDIKYCDDNNLEYSTINLTKKDFEMYYVFNVLNNKKVNINNTISEK